jgi:hypothetical protein
MKKSIFILITALFVLGLSRAYAQDPVITPTPLDPSCINLADPLHPVPGNPYTYEVSVPVPPGTKTYHWLVTQDQQFIIAGVFNPTVELIGGPILAAGSGWYNVATVDQPSISLTWQSFVLDPTEYVFVVIYVENVGATCTNDNMKVYRIQPAHAFTLDIANVDSTANVIAGNNLAQCADPVFSAVFDPTFGTDGGVIYDYGVNIFYYAVSAANYSGQFEFYAQFDGLQAATPAGTIAQSANVYWGYTMAGIDANGPFPLTVATNGVAQDLGMVTAPAGTVGSAGQMIYIKVVIQNHTFEAAGQPQYNYTFAINGTLVDATGTPLVADDTMDDLHYADCSPDAFVNDVTTQVITQRPTINSVSPVPPGFLPITD